MPTFSYTARDLQGVDHKGTIETVDAHQVARVLSKKGLIVTSIKQHDMTKSGSYIDNLIHRVSFSEVVIATRQLATMIESGLVLSEGLDILADQQKPGRLKQVLEEVSRDIKSGLDLATAFRKHPEAFPP